MRTRITGPAGLQWWLASIREDLGDLREYAARTAWMAEKNEAVFCWEELVEGGVTGFTWVCPGCGGLGLGALAAEPQAGWDVPRWVNSGTRNRPTLRPALDCPHCERRYWLRDGELISARRPRGR